MAIRALAADKRVCGAICLQPVTDWRLLDEFSSATADRGLEKIRLHNYVSQIAGRPIYIAIGNADARVSTPACVEFHDALRSANQSKGFDDSLTPLILTSDKGHSLDICHFVAAAEFQLDADVRAYSSRSGADAAAPRAAR